VGSTPDNSSGAEDENLWRFVGHTTSFLDRPTDVCVTRNIDEGRFDRQTCQLAVRPAANRAVWVVLEQNGRLVVRPFEQGANRTFGAKQHKSSRTSGGNSVIGFLHACLHVVVSLTIPGFGLFRL
jgi:hypothetical protein